LLKQTRTFNLINELFQEKIQKGSQSNNVSKINFINVFQQKFYFSALLPAEGVNISPAFLPSRASILWNGEEALRNHTARNIRFDQMHHQTRWSAGSDGSFSLKSTYLFAGKISLKY